MTSYQPLSFDRLSTYSLFERESKVTAEDFAAPPAPGLTVREWLKGLPNQLLGRDFPELIRRLADCHRHLRPIVVGLGAHVIKVGLNPVLIELMERGIVSALALNGAGIVHDTELAIAGRTSEDVEQVLGRGAFGAARETGEFINQAINRGHGLGLGIGAAVGQALVEGGFPHNRQSLLATAHRLKVPLTVHVAIGTDIIHLHPSANGAAIGAGSHLDFRLFCGVIADLEGGAYLNLGSAVLLPEVFLKALTVVRNLGHEVRRFTTANFDFIRHYRPLTNVVNRPTADGGKGYAITGHHELMIPLLAACLLDELAAG
ncbi:MAG: hypothetical protein M0T76_00980 [Desulfobacteraceae bacterium]|nr:hypothetical protein [Desulfobacteraceae bacterium]